jgi:hypothetical protein
MIENLTWEYLLQLVWSMMAASQGLGSKQIKIMGLLKKMENL